MIRNRDLYASPSLRNDECFLVTRPPKWMGDHVLIEVDLDAPAAVLHRHRDRYPRQPYSDEEIRKGQIEGVWLLSGGAVVMDHEGRIALGLRDGNAAAPFTYTNIAAGRCDGPLLEHCLEEIASECLLFVRVARRGWLRVDLGPSTARVAARDLPCMAAWLEAVGVADSPRVKLETCRPESLPAGVDFLPLVVERCSRDVCEQREALEGYVFLNGEEHTTEFRILRAFDLSSYAQEERKLIFGEGTGHAVWKTPEQIRALCRIQERWGTPLVTPFLKRLVAR